MQIKDEGFIDIKSSILSGHIKSGFVGITLIFLGVLISLFCIAINRKTKVEISKGDMKVTYFGPINQSILRSIVEDTCNRLFDKKYIGNLVDTPKQDGANKANSADAKSRSAD